MDQSVAMDQPVELIPVEGVAPTGRDLRRAERFTLLVRTAKLVVDGREYLGVLRDASSTGCRMRLFHPIPSGEALALETANGLRFAMDMVWHHDDYAGFHFHHPIDVQRLIKDQPGPYARRQIRISVEREASVLAHGRAFPVMLHNISQHGACIGSPERLMLHQSLRLDVMGFPSIHAKVCWRQAPRHGLVFDGAFGLDELAGYLHRLHDGASARPSWARAWPFHP